MRFLKGQAAMEYLITYGWVLFLLVAVVAVLYASGIFAPSRFISQECRFQPDFSCTDYALVKPTATTSRLIIRVRNGLGFPIKMSSMNLTTTDMGSAGKKTWICPSASCTFSPAFTTVLQQGDEMNMTITFTGTTQPTVGAMKEILMGITYQNCATAANPVTCSGGTPSSHSISGKVTTKLEKG